MNTITVYGSPGCIYNKLNTMIAKTLLVWYASACGLCCRSVLVAVLMTYPVAWYFRVTPDIADSVVFTLWLAPCCMVATAVSDYMDARRRVKLQRDVIVYPEHVWIQTLTSICTLLATVMALYVSIVYVKTLAIQGITTVPKALQWHIGMLLTPCMVLIILGYYGKRRTGIKTVIRNDCGYN